MFLLVWLSIWWLFEVFRHFHWFREIGLAFLIVGRSSNSNIQHFLLGGYKLRHRLFEYFKLPKILWSVIIFPWKIKCFINRRILYLNKVIWLDIEEATTACSNWTDSNFKPFICLRWYDYFIFIYFRKVTIPLFDRNRSVFEILLKYMDMKSLDCQLKLITLVMVTFVDNICSRREVPIFCTKLIGINMYSLLSAGVIVVHIVIAI